MAEPIFRSEAWDKTNRLKLDLPIDIGRRSTLERRGSVASTQS